MAKGDDKALKLLERFASPEALVDKVREQDRLISSGQLRRPLPDNATAEQVAAWRKDNGIPEKPDGYFEKLPDGLVIGETDKPIVEQFAAALHGANAPPAAVHAAVKWYNEWQEQAAAAISTQDANNAKATEAALKQEWGGDYETNVNVRASFLNTMPEEVREAWKTARLPDGTLLGERPELSRWLVSLARDIDPVASIPPGSGIGPGGKTVDGRISEIAQMMKNKNSAYWKGPKNARGKTEVEAEYLRLLEVKERSGKR